MKLTLHPYTHDYFDACVALFKSNQGKYFTSEEETDYRNFLSNLTDRDTYYVIHTGSRVVAAGGFADEGDYVVLSWGMVANDLHNNGIGDFLTANRIERARQIFPNKELRIETSQHTADFYARYGFNVKSITADGFGRGIDKVVMIQEPGQSKYLHDNDRFQTNLILEGDNLLLRPMQEDDFKTLFAVASDPQIWTLHPANDRYKESVFKEYFASGIISGMAFIIEEKTTKTVIGSSRYHAPNYAASSIEIGWTFLARRCWGGPINAELKHLMIRHAFDTFAKVHFCIGADNHRSITAVKKLGAYHQPDIIDADRASSVIYELTKDTYVGLANYGKQRRSSQTGEIQ